MSEPSEAAPAWHGDVAAGVAAWLGEAGPPPDFASLDDATLPAERAAERVGEPAEGRATARGRRSGTGRSGQGRSGRGRGAAPQDTAALGPDADPESVARKILLDALTGQARSRKELADKLAAKGVPDDLASRLLDRFEEVGLVDDEAFARAWIASRRRADSGGGKGLARRALAQELRRKGIDDEVAREALDEIDPDDELEVARTLVRRKLRSVAGLDEAKATRRLVGMLARKGHGAGVAYRVVREELAFSQDTANGDDFA